MSRQDSAQTIRESFRLKRSLAALAAFMLLAGSLCFALTMQPERVVAFRPLEEGCLVIDPGHGGIDGGAIAYNGVRESELNLAIGLKLRDLATFCGVSTRMTREDDSSRTEQDSYSEHEELVYRAELAEQTPNGVLISIHQNTFPTSQPRGAQVLYGLGESSRRLGELTHSNLVQALQPENRRVAAPAPSELYLTSHVSRPAILVECGFLSNLSDLQLVSDSRYQTALALVLLSSYLQFSFSQTVT